MGMTPARPLKFHRGPLFISSKKGKAFLGLTPFGDNNLKTPEGHLETDLFCHR
jgi:hypothetical protein